MLAFNCFLKSSATWRPGDWGAFWSASGIWKQPINGKELNLLIRNQRGDSKLKAKKNHSNFITKVKTFSMIYFKLVCLYKITTFFNQTFQEGAERFISIPICHRKEAEQVKLKGSLPKYLFLFSKNIWLMFPVLFHFQ